MKDGEENVRCEIICARKYAWIINDLIPVLHRMQRQRKKIRSVTLRTRAGIDDLTLTAWVERAKWNRDGRKAGVR